jgi:ParB family chromosome partitioning protein
MRPKGLGRGLDALLSGDEGSRREEQRTLPVGSLKPGKYQPRTRMDSESLQELAASIKAQGIMQPILVRPVDGKISGKFGDNVGDRYEIVAGERRWRAAQLAGLVDVPTLIREIPDESALAMALIENIQREDLNPLEEALGLQRLIDEFGMTHQQAADAVGRSRPAATNLLRLLQLTPPVQEMLMGGDIDMGHARALLPMPAVQQVTMAQRIAQKKLSVREAERMVAKAQEPPKSTSEPKEDRDLLRLEEELSDTLGAAVAIRANRKGSGRITIEFSNLDQLDGILAQLR